MGLAEPHEALSSLPIQHMHTHKEQFPHKLLSVSSSFMLSTSQCSAARRLHRKSIVPLQTMCPVGLASLEVHCRAEEEACGRAHVLVPRINSQHRQRNNKRHRLVLSLDHLPILFCILLLLLRYLVAFHVFFQSLQKSTVLRTMWINFLAQETGYRFCRIKLNWPEEG